ncbi:hypothetical protein ACH3XW_18770 [Acanthocheilonema viteae]
MNVREFLSNDYDFNEQIPYHDLCYNWERKNYLGIIWKTRWDTIMVTLKPWNEEKETKRSILKFIASQY